MGGHECSTDQGGDDRYVCVGPAEVVSTGSEEATQKMIDLIGQLFGDKARETLSDLLGDDASDRKSGSGNDEAVEKGASCKSNSDCDKTDECVNKRCAVTYLLKPWASNSKCADAYERNKANGLIKTWGCSSSNQNQQWEYDHELQRIKNKHGMCMSAGSHHNDNIITLACDKSQMKQLWDYNPLTGLIKNMYHDKCLDAHHRNTNDRKIALWSCDATNKNQQWFLTPKK
jgi:hypothetical protein